jgi:hypothetical protein
MKTKLIGFALLCAVFCVGCSAKKSNYEVSTADTVSINNKDTASQTKLVKTADMHFRVKNVERTSRDIAALAVQYNGMVMHHSMQSVINKSQDMPLDKDSVMHIAAYTVNADMVVKISSDKLEEFMNQVSKMAVYTNNRNMDIQDKTLDYLSAQMKVAGRNQIITQQRAGKIVIKNPEAVLDLKDDQVDKEIGNKRTNEQVKYSTIALNFYQDNAMLKEIIANDDPSNFILPFATRLGQTLANGLFIFNETVIALANLWAFILLGIAAYIAYRRYKKKPHVAVS